MVGKGRLRKGKVLEKLACTQVRIFDQHSDLKSGRVGKRAENLQTGFI
jgi:hypothetical protein